jgi:hypothetical protein
MRQTFPVIIVLVLLMCDSGSWARETLRRQLDAPLLFVKRHAYMAGHIYDDYLTWRPGGGVYVIENPWDEPGQHRVRAVIDASTPETLGEGVYRDPNLSWDAKRIVFAFKGMADGDTSIYEIGVDGTGLRQLTRPHECDLREGTCRIGSGHHDITPCYLPDGRIVFSSTRPGALVPCFNSGVDTLHVMDADGGNLHGLSVNNVNEFDPAVMHDGRILYGRWEYVDKTALYMQSLWTISPDGRMEEALFANNLAKPTAILRARPVPNSRLIAAALTPHNGQAVGAIVMIDPYQGKNHLGAITNFTPEYPVEMDQGLMQGPSDPWPLHEDLLLIANNASGQGVIELVSRCGGRELVFADPEIDCYSPMLVRPRAIPATVSQVADRGQATTGRFLLADVYQGLAGIERGTIKQLRIIEETARVSGLPPGGRWWNQAFLISWQGGYVVKNVLGTVPVHEDGSAYFETPSGKALYFSALDAEGREIQRMRTHVQAAPAANRSCVGCHENKNTTPLVTQSSPLALQAAPARPRNESWGSGFIDFPTMVQPVLDKYCVRCHGGPEGISRGLDFSGGWTWAFNIAYETLLKHRLTGFLNCENGSVHTAEILPPKSIGSGAAPLTDILIRRHPEMSRAERDLLLAWMDTNSNYYGTWDYTEHATCDAILSVRSPLADIMNQAGCTDCHAAGHIGNDWINLQQPEWSRILRAPLRKSEGGLGVAFCRHRPARTGYPLVDQSQQPPDIVYPTRHPAWDPSGEPYISFAGAEDPYYQEMLTLIRQARREALARPRIDMPGADVIPGQIRMPPVPAIPDTAPPVAVRLLPGSATELSWKSTADVVGLHVEIHRHEEAAFVPDDRTLLAETTSHRFLDPTPPIGQQHYAIRLTAGKARSRPAFASIDVPPPPPPVAPGGLQATPQPGEICLEWDGDPTGGTRFHLFRQQAESPPILIHSEPLRSLRFADADVSPDSSYTYTVRALDRRGQFSEPSASVTAAPLPKIQVFSVDFQQTVSATRLAHDRVAGQLHGEAHLSDRQLRLEEGGFASFTHLPEFDLERAISVECRFRIDKPADMPVIVSCGAFAGRGWFLQQFGAGWRWHVGGTSCDGGQPVLGEWVHLVGTFSGRRACLYQNGRQVASIECAPNTSSWSGPLIIGQYSSQQPAFQVYGSVSNVHVFRGALTSDEVIARYQRFEETP